jgi:hypothetical protein
MKWSAVTETVTGTEAEQALHATGVGAGMGVEGSVSGISVSSQRITVTCEDETEGAGAKTWTNPATAEGAIRRGIESSIGWK